jgi:hypothetical protein
MRANRPDEVEDYFKVVGDFRASGKRQSMALLTGRQNAPDNHMLLLSSGGDDDGKREDWTSPRHRHTFEQVRYPLSGDYVISKDNVLPAGWVAYFPESAYYGPQVKSGNLTMLVVQLGGPSGLGYANMRQYKDASDRLTASGGVFANGMYSWVDGAGKRHNQDASEAVEAEIRGHRVTYPEPRYNGVVAMNPAAFDWVKDPDNPGVARKYLGTFTEREIRIGFVYLDKGATLRFGTEPSGEALFVKDGAIAYDNQRFDAHAAFGTEAGEAPVELTAIEPSELFYLKLPTF